MLLVLADRKADNTNEILNAVVLFKQTTLIDIGQTMKKVSPGCNYS